MSNRNFKLFDSTYCGTMIRQYWSDLCLWELFLNKHDDIELVIELGTLEAGMSTFLLSQCVNRHKCFWTFDRNKPKKITPLMEKLGINFIHGDFFADSHQVLIDLLSLKCCKLLFCDGGNKPLEFQTFVPMLQQGDYVAVHDYGTEFQPVESESVEHLVEMIFVDECVSVRPCLTRFWRRR